MEQGEFPLHKGEQVVDLGEGQLCQHALQLEADGLISGAPDLAHKLALQGGLLR